MKNSKFENLVVIMGCCAIASLIINIPNMFGYSKMYQISAFGLASFIFMILSFFGRRSRES